MMGDVFLEERQDTVIDSDSLVILLVSVAAFIGQLLAVFIGNLLTPRYKLENDVMCGVTTGGREDCFWDCKIDSTEFSNGPYITTPECLLDCFPEGNCLNTLIKDFIANGTCDTGQPSPFESDKITTCTFMDLPDGGGLGIDTGVCSDLTEELLKSRDECGFILREQTNLIFNTLTQFMLPFMCKTTTVSTLILSTSVNVTRLVPIESVTELEDATLSTNLNSTNTRHRYPWLCSVRSKGTNPKHYCAVTLLSRPPAPTVLVGPAHCTDLCKSSRGEVDNCCCGGPNDCSDNIARCGNRPTVVEMTGNDAEILCGEWETGDAPSEASGEQYNIVLFIRDIVKHPNYRVLDTSAYLENDIAVFKVDDSVLTKDITETFGIYPACLPIQQRTASSGFHSGWSSPIPFHILSQYASGFTKVYRDFFKQIHYKMDILERCVDANKLAESGQNAQFPTNTYYPPGTVCARNRFVQSCFYSGESGSPLMIRDEESERLYAEGFLSFIKGCTLLALSNVTGQNGKLSILFQETEKPSVYTKLSCYLPWIAEQYDMDFNENIQDDKQECTTGNGDINDYNAETCRCNCPFEDECIFPFYWNGKRFDQCTFLEEQEFLFPVFRCPTRNITRKINGINSFVYADFVKQQDELGLCVAEGQDPQDITSELDPDRECDPIVIDPETMYPDYNDDGFPINQRFTALSPCKNNCRGVNFSVVSGGAALIAATSVVGQLVAPALGAAVLGIGGVGGNMVAQNMCLGPVYCRAASGQCCIVIIRGGAAICPRRCGDDNDDEV